MADFEALSTDQLVTAHGGLRMKLTQYGYADDPYMDSYTKKGKGKWRDLQKGTSIAMTDSALAALGVDRSSLRKKPVWLEVHLGRRNGGGVLIRRVDDRAPQREHRADLYQPGGFDRSLPDYADVRIHRPG